jgi:hypothetical protein
MARVTTTLPRFKIETGERKPAIDFEGNSRYRDYLKVVYDYNGNITAAELQNLLPAHEPTERQKAALAKAHQASAEKRQARGSSKGREVGRTLVRRAVQQHLSKLHHNGYLRRYGEKNLVLYTLGPRAVEPLVDFYDADPRWVRLLQARSLEPGKYYLNHSRLVSRIHFYTDMAARGTTGVTLGNWLHDGQVSTEVQITAANQKRVTIPIVPDATFSLESADGGARYFFLEADRTMSTHQRFTKKMLAFYRGWKRPPKGRSHIERHFDISHFFVLVVCVSHHRLTGLHDKTLEVLSSDPVYAAATKGAAKRGGNTGPSGIAFVHEDAFLTETGYTFPALTDRFIPFV